MSAMFDQNPNEIHELLAKAVAGDGESLGALLKSHREKLKRMIGVRMDRRLQGRVDPSDVIQEAQLEASHRLQEYADKPTMPFFLWLRLITGQRLMILHRQHLGVKMRSAKREVSLDQGHMPQATSAALAAQLLGNFTSPSVAAIRAEAKAQLHAALEAMDPHDRDVLTLRHFEQLSTSETAHELGISLEAAKKRHIRALKKLKEILGDIAQLLGGEAHS